MSCVSRWGGLGDPIHYEAGPDMLLRSPQAPAVVLEGGRITAEPRVVPALGRGALPPVPCW